MQLNDSSLFRQQCYLGGQWADADDGATFDVLNPADGSVLGAVPKMGASETARAIDAAQAAMPAWAGKTAKERSAILRRWYELILENQSDLAMIMTAEMGKPLAEAMAEIVYGASFVEWFAEEAKRVYGDTIPAPSNDRRIVVIKQPIGVVASITPWNFPTAMITRKCAPALAAGCPVVIKPAEDTPYSAFALAELAERAGIPAGIINIISGVPADIGGELTSNPVVRKLSFTGSTPVGKLLMKQCADTVKKVSMELGGNAPFIIFDDADINAAITGVMASKYRNTGQTCVCANRILVQDSIYDEFAEKLVAAVAKLSVGPGLTSNATQGPLINEKALEKVEGLVADAVEKGAKVVLGGKRSDLGATFYEPTVLTDIDPGMRMANEEIFGPVAPLYRFKTEAEAVAMANDTPFGLAAYFYSRDIGRVWRVSEALEYGIVGANEGIISSEVAPFGGVKESGIGREGSKYGIEEYVEIKYMCLGGM
ncbi:MAG: NAD-dependent succinate-semialdehyde dehydrogenase [Rhodospirillaceae bacterium]|jgi:succinate-semialdehyde dehydrogenase / glutarate-semialdehyde dehydrogenase|nr:NAD-dependent succinate-semialdehyde dehydrogenase [Rhodospirillaceae bacterium]MBT5242637.1 NAD-dependent succinate-semialdehyde dehydrogenase [Rhodospirillaceae bacterium]MBT5562800.1 NAD-dependent succinate-semialdehyde dehydrogenase [Rhodospirillaceae bacterium]MBT6241229.1 NAD-dependent succinate-semialdehyde dehydrogenase [Rhodospirillaceae bacterium]MBT7137518.1 NAD-dependent succinate-semialdehyde dehydrogenase [Rhodospirillaceae bacterium]